MCIAFVSGRGSMGGEMVVVIREFLGVQVGIGGSGIQGFFWRVLQGTSWSRLQHLKGSVIVVGVA